MQRSASHIENMKESKSKVDNSLKNEHFTQTITSNTAVSPFNTSKKTAEIDQEPSFHSLFTEKETSFYLDMFERIIVPDCPSAALNIVHKYCVEILSKSIEKHSHAKASTRSDNNVTISDHNSEMETSVSSTKVFTAFLLRTELKSFPDLITTLCAGKPRHGHRSIDLAILELLLSTNGLHRHSVIDAPLTFGDVPIMHAARAHDYDVMRLLLRHSADVARPWMAFKSPLEIALFSPSERYVGDAEMERIERCVTLLLTAMPRINLPRMDELKRASYQPLHAEWRKVVVDGMAAAWGIDSGVVASLRHLCRCAVRSSFRFPHRLAENVRVLPIPTCLKRYVSLDDDATLH